MVTSGVPLKDFSMKLHKTKAKQVLAKFVDTVILPQTPPFGKFLLTLSLLSLNNIPYLDFFCDQNGDIDLAKLKPNAEQALAAAGGSFLVPVLNWNFDQDDLNKIFSIAQEFAHE